MAVCTFFGHKDSPEGLWNHLERIISNLIENFQTDRFYVGHQGNFDRMAIEILRRISPRYPHIRYEIVLAYLPSSNSAAGLPADVPAFLPEGIENVPPRFAILYRNQWMIRHADYVVSGVSRSWGGAARSVELAIKWNKIILSIPDVSSGSDSL